MSMEKGSPATVQCDARAPEASQVWQIGDEFAGKNIMYRVS
jgi:hypothetical protein